MPIRRVAADEGLDRSSLIRCPVVLQEGSLPAQLQPQAHNLDVIRLVEPRVVNHTSSRRRYSSIYRIQIGEWKYCTDNNLKDTAHHLIK
jgi:hypothetical protein